MKACTSSLEDNVFCVTKYVVIHWVRRRIERWIYATAQVMQADWAKLNEIPLQ